MNPYRLKEQSLFKRYSVERLKAYCLWASENKDVIDNFLRIAYRLKRSGFSRYSADAICHIIRWEMIVESYKPNAKAFKIDNNNVALIARHACLIDRTLTDFFRIKFK